jgi:2-polyprenyl-3-methyl-5-hydroxy-6-metoxy-1,4-benzoquinol methylase
MLFASPVRPELLNGRFYDREGSEYYTSVDKVSGDFVPIRFHRELRVFQSYCRSGRVLDVGCNTGAFLHQLRVNNPGQYEVVGADVSGPALEHARKAGIPVLEGPFDTHDFPGPSFDALTFWAVLEHVNQPLEFLRKAGSVLKPQGYCFVLVPNMRSLAVRLLGSRYRYVMPEHINYFTASTLARMAEAAGGFETVELRSSHFNPVVLGQDLLRPRSHVPAAERAALLKRTNAWKSNPRLRPVQFMYKTMEAVLSRLGLADNLILVLQRLSSARIPASR